MEKREIAENIFRYTFLSAGRPDSNQHVYVLTDGSKAAVIDPSFKEYSRQVRSDLDRQGIIITDVIISHFDRDHFEGILEMEEVRVLGSPHYLPTLKELCSREELDRIGPVSCVEPGMIYSAAGFSIRFREGRGHRRCGLFTIIDDTYIHCNDLLLATASGRPILPYIKDSAEHYRQSLLFLRERKEQVLMAHGSLESPEAIRRDLDLRLKYLERLLTGKGPFRLEEFEFRHLHRLNMKKIRTGV